MYLTWERSDHCRTALRFFRGQSVTGKRPQTRRIREDMLRLQSLRLSGSALRAFCGFKFERQIFAPFSGTVNDASAAISMLRAHAARNLLVSFGLSPGIRRALPERQLLKFRTFAARSTNWQDVGQSCRSAICLDCRLSDSKLPLEIANHVALQHTQPRPATLAWYWLRSETSDWPEGTPIRSQNSAQTIA